MPVRMTGIERVLRAIGKAKADGAIKIRDGLEKCAWVIYRKSQGYVPVETGALKESGLVEVSGQGNGARASVVYGGPGAPYAVFVHEDLTKHHKPPTCAQFLTRALRETRGTCANILKREFAGEQVKTDTGGAA